MFMLYVNHSFTGRYLTAQLIKNICRFHALTEFDEGKRSCRKRLEGHNRRRRKPQPETLPVNHENFLSATPGFSSSFETHVWLLLFLPIVEHIAVLHFIVHYE